MRFEIGQDAFGQWAWMLFDSDGVLLASDDRYKEAAIAMEDALNAMELRDRAERRKAESRG